jgi:hypothetical protein
LVYVLKGRLVVLVVVGGQGGAKDLYTLGMSGGDQLLVAMNNVIR